MKLNLLFFLVIITIFIQNSNAQFPVDTPYTSIFSDTPPLPAYLGSVEDNSVPDPITITRITEFDADRKWYPKHEYSKIQPWNANTTVYKFYSVAIYNAKTHQIIRTLPGSKIYPSYWSNTNSDLLYSFREDGEIRTYSVANDKVYTINTIQGYSVVKLGPGEGNIDKNDRYVALVGKKGVDMDVIVFDLKANKIVYTEPFKGAWGDNDDVPKFVDWVSVSQSGKYVGIMWNHNTTSQDNPFKTHYGVEIYNTTNMKYLRRIAVYGNHGDFGYAIDGAEVFVQFWGPTGTVNMYYLDRMERAVLTNHSDFSGGGHISCRNLNRPGWAYINQKEVKHSRQIVAMKLDGSGLVEHFGHHYSSSASYAKSPMPVPSPNGEKVMFKSDFEKNSGNAPETYCFEAIKSSVLAVEHTDEVSFSLYPNPSKKTIHIESKEAITEVIIYNAIGEIVKEISNLNKQAVEIDIDNLANSAYIIRLKGNESYFKSKIFIKN